MFKSIVTTIKITTSIIDSIRVFLTSAKKVNLQTIRSLHRLSTLCTKQIKHKKKNKIRKKCFKSLEKIESVMKTHQQQHAAGKPTLTDEEWNEIKTYLAEIKENLSESLDHEHLSDQDKKLIDKVILLVTAQEAYLNNNPIMNSRDYDQLLKDMAPELNHAIALLTRANNEYLSGKIMINDDEYNLLKKSIALLFNHTHHATLYDLDEVKEKVIMLHEAKMAFDNNSPIISNEKYDELACELNIMKMELTKMIDDANAIYKMINQLIVVPKSTLSQAKDIISSY